MPPSPWAVVPSRSYGRRDNCALRLAQQPESETGLATAPQRQVDPISAHGGAGLGRHLGRVHIVFALARALHVGGRDRPRQHAAERWLAVGTEKVTEVMALVRGLRDGRDAVAAEVAASNEAVRLRSQATRRAFPQRRRSSRCLRNR